MSSGYVERYAYDVRYQSTRHVSHTSLFLSQNIHLKKKKHNDWE